MTPRLIENWAVEDDPREPYLAPEQSPKVLSGDVAGRNGPVITSRIVRTEGRFVHTSSGSVYQLGRPSEVYLKWLADNGLVLDEAQPVKVPEARR